MNTNENIKNALHVLYKTYENIEKLMDSCKAIAGDAGYCLSVPKFIRWKSDNDSAGWLLNSFILLFQRSEAMDCESENEWKNGPVYALEICLGIYGDEQYLPKVLLTKFIYHDINDWSKGCSPASHWAFHNPVHLPGISNMKQDGEFQVSTPNSEKNSDAYWGLKNAVTLSFPLTELNSENLRDRIFGSFDKLSAYQNEA